MVGLPVGVSVCHCWCVWSDGVLVGPLVSLVVAMLVAVSMGV